MKKIITYCLLLTIVCTSTKVKSQDWHQAPSGNVAGGGDYCGTNNNVQMNIRTSAQHRFRINENITPTINMVPIARDGFVGIGPGGYFAANSPWTMLHLEGPDNTASGGASFGWRNWMSTGTYTKENSASASKILMLC